MIRDHDAVIKTGRPLLMLAALFLVFGCNKDAEPGAGKLNEQRTQYTCTADSECVTSCTVAGDCCGKGCVCDQAYHKDEFAKVLRENRKLCEGKQLDCDQYSCPESAPLVGKCEKGKCVARPKSEEKKPPETEGRMDQGFFMAPGAPPPNSCTVADDCIGDTVPSKDGCCNNPYKVVPHSKAYRKWVYSWRQTNCKNKKCPAPPSPARPADCLFKMSCEAGVCRNSCPTKQPAVAP